MGPGPSAGSCTDTGRHGRTRHPARPAARVGHGGRRPPDRQLAHRGRGLDTLRRRAGPTPDGTRPFSRPLHRHRETRSYAAPGPPDGTRRTRRRPSERQLAYRESGLDSLRRRAAPTPDEARPSAGSCTDAGRHGRTRHPARPAAHVGHGGIRLIVNRHTGLGNWTFSGAGGAHPVKPRPHRAASRIPRPAMPEVGPAAPESARPHPCRRCRTWPGGRPGRRRGSWRPRCCEPPYTRRRPGASRRRNPRPRAGDPG